MKRQKDLLFVPYILLVVVIVAMFYELSRMIFVSKIELFDLYSPLIFCFLVAFGLLFFLVLSFVGDLKQKQAAAKEEEKEVAVDVEELKRIILYVLGLIIYIMLLPRLHFVAATLIYMAIIVFLLTEATAFTTKLLRAVISSIIFVPVVYYIFYGIFNVVLP